MSASLSSLRTVQCHHPSPLYYRCLDVRSRVFGGGQGKPQRSISNEKDIEADHLLLVAMDEAGTENDVGTVRWWPVHNAPAGKVGRLCVVDELRGTGAGRFLLDAVEDHVRNRQGRAGAALQGQSSVLSYLSSEEVTRRFYEKAEYQVQGEQFMEDGALQWRMEKELKLEDE